MRRKDREITDPEKIRQIIDGCHCCRLGLCDQGRAYLVPLNFGYAQDESGQYTFYFHGAKEGRKIDLMRRDRWAAFEMDMGFRLHEAEKACGWTAAFCSVTGGGEITFLEEPEAKRRALGRIMAHLSGREDWSFPDAAVESTCVYRLEVRELACKEHL